MYKLGDEWGLERKKGSMWCSIENGNTCLFWMQYWYASGKEDNNLFSWLNKYGKTGIKNRRVIRKVTTMGHIWHVTKDKRRSTIGRINDMSRMTCENAEVRICKRNIWQDLFGRCTPHGATYWNRLLDIFWIRQRKWLSCIQLTPAHIHFIKATMIKNNSVHLYRKKECYRSGMSRRYI